MTQYERDRYLWRKTWPDHENDFVGYDGANKLGRFYELRTPEGMKWVWYFQFDHGTRGNPAPTGISDTPREAAKELERAYQSTLSKAAPVEITHP
jgi:hypothetical protein